MKKQIMACIDGSAIAASVCDTAAWASAVLGASLKLLHVLEKSITPGQEDLSGAIGLGTREHLLSELVELDERRNKIAIEHGKHMLEDARLRAQAKGAYSVCTEQRHDKLLDALLEYEEETRLFVIGRLGEDHDVQRQTIGSHVESVVRAIHTPILIASGKFSPPSNYMLAYDGSETADRAIERIANSPLLLNLSGHVVMVAAETPENRQRLEQAAGLLSASGHTVQCHLIQGSVVEALAVFHDRFAIQLKVMGAYGHSRIREFFIGSNTTRMIGSSRVPLLLLR